MKINKAQKWIIFSLLIALIAIWTFKSMIHLQFGITILIIVHSTILFKTFKS